ncbi:replication initiator protein [Vibrio phage vB_VpaM_PG19]|nr:replication initiator protein [Vibrio phage vB_VpaM_PG19]
MSRINDTFKAIIKPIIESIGKGHMRRSSKLFDMWCSVQSRLDYLYKVQDYHRKREDNEHNPKRIDEDFTQRHTQLRMHFEFVREQQRLLDINNTIDHGTNDAHFEQLFKDWKDYLTYYPKYVCDAMFDMPLPEGTYHDAIAKVLIEGQAKTRRAMYLQRLNNELKLAAENNWYIIFDTLTLDGAVLKDYLQDETAIRDYCRTIGRKVNTALGRPKKASYTDSYKYFIVPEYGDQNGRLHFHCIHLLRRLPVGTCDPNLGRKVRNARVVDSLRGTWKYGFSAPIAVRFHGDAFTRLDNWLLPVDKSGIPIELKPITAIIHYVAKYVCKNTDAKKAFNLKRSKSKWAITLNQLKLNAKTNRISMSRGFGMTMPTMEYLSLDALQQLTRIHWSVSDKNLLLRENARRELSARMQKLTLNQLIQTLPSQTNLLEQLRALIQTTPDHKLLSSGISLTPSLTTTDISNETFYWIWANDLLTKPKPKHEKTFGTK